MARTGRRPGPSTTRATILEAARRRFADRGYDATSIRAIAAGAGVDPGVVMHFFGSKDALFQAAVGWPFDPARPAAQIAARRRRTPRNRAAPFHPARLAAQIAAPGPEGIGAPIA